MSQPDSDRPLIFGNQIACWAIEGLPEIEPGADLAAMGSAAMAAAGGLAPWDVVVVTHKAISKEEGRIYSLDSFRPGARAQELAEALGSDPRLIEAVLLESRRVVRAEQGVLVTETVQGLVCANAGIDRSNVGGGELITCLPLDPDGSAERLRRAWLPMVGGGELGVIVSDTFGRPFREGSVNVAIGVAGMPALSDHRGLRDAQGYELHASTIGSADEIASIGELLMGKIDGRPLAVVRGLGWSGPSQGAVALQRDAARDIFRR